MTISFNVQKLAQYRSMKREQMANARERAKIILAVHKLYKTQ